MAIHRLLEHQAFSPQDVQVLVAAYERVLGVLHLKPDRYAAANELIATKVIEVAQTGIRDASAIAERVLSQMPSGAADPSVARGDGPPTQS